MFTLFLEGLEFYAYHGVPDAEQVVGHRYVAELELDVRGKAARTDSIDDTVDYAAVAQAVAGHAQANQYRTLERLADALCGAVMDQFPNVVEVRLRLAKRLPPAEIIAEAAGVEMVRSRGED